MQPPIDILFRARLIATMAGPQPYGLMEDAAIGVSAGRIVWIGQISEAPSATKTHDVGEALITPALIDCHTHLVHGGNRATEFEMRLHGATYESIAKAGGGIRATVGATRAATEEELVQSALPRLDALLAEGVSVVEVKSGYGLDIPSERKMLRAARRLQAERKVRIITSFLGAHTVPDEYAHADDYIAHLCDEMLPALHAEGLIDMVDGYCERIAFSVAHMERLFNAAQSLGLPLRLHAEQLSDMGGAAMAARHGALSVDHLEYLKPQDAAVLAKHHTVAVLLPGAFYFLRETTLPPIDALRSAGVAMAIATDCNPGTSPLTSLLLAMNMACTLFRLTPEEALRGCTLNAAKALGVANEYGSIELGKQADFSVWQVQHPAELAYRMGARPLISRIIKGCL